MNGHAHLGGSALDSNVDWGQDLLFLKNWVDQHAEANTLRVALSGPCDPSLIGLPQVRPPDGPDYVREGLHRPESAIGPLPGWYAISVNALHSRSKEYAYFLYFEPAGAAGYSIARGRGSRRQNPFAAPRRPRAQPTPGKKPHDPLRLAPRRTHLLVSRGMALD